MAIGMTIFSIFKYRPEFQKIIKNARAYAVTLTQSLKNCPKYCYKLAREYVEGYGLQSGSGIVAESVPMLLEVAEFWCQYYFNESLSEKFPGEGDRYIQPNQ